jgi:hypothetical protein
MLRKHDDDQPEGAIEPQTISPNQSEAAGALIFKNVSVFIAFKCFVGHVPFIFFCFH